VKGITTKPTRDVLGWLATCVLLSAAIVGGLAKPRLHGQAPQTSEQKGPTFEVASVKQNTSVSDVSNTTSAGGRFTITNSPLPFIILQAYHLLDHELVGGPEWIKSTHGRYRTSCRWHVPESDRG
jgi:hypothetical protein